MPAFNNLLPILKVKITLPFSGIFAKMGNHDQALQVFHSGESMALSLLATVIERNVLSLDELPASITNCRQFILSGAIWLKDHFPEAAADAFIRWKSFFTELRAILIQLGLRDTYRAAFQAIESKAMGGDESESDILKTFKADERKLQQKYILSTIRAMYDQGYNVVAQALEKSDVAIDYTFKIYNPEHQTPPKSQACALVIRPQQPPVLVIIDDKRVHDLLQQWPQAIYKLWYSQDQEFNHVSKSLSDALFPHEVKKVLLDPLVKRIFISPDADLMCFPIDQLPLTDDKNSTLPLFERLSVSILSSPRELVREKIIRNLKELNTIDAKGKDVSVVVQSKGQVHYSPMAPPEESSSASKQSEGQSEPIKEDAFASPKNEVSALSEGIRKLQVHKRNTSLECFIIANPDYRHERPLEQKAISSSTWMKWLEALSGLMGIGAESHHIQELKGSQKEAEAVYHLLVTHTKLRVHPPLMTKEASVSSLLNLKSPHVLHIATHGYCSKQESMRYRGNFWTDQSSGILLAGAQTFHERKFEKMDARAGTGHMNAVAACGMQLDGTRLVFVSTCNSSVGTRPVQEMPDSFTQALRAAGAETIISTLWAVTDTETSKFVTYFYDRLVNIPQCHPSEALSYAKAMMKQKRESMFHWGAFICQGLDRPL